MALEVCWCMRMAGDRWCTHCACKDGLSISVYQKNIDYASGAGADCGAILGMMFGCFWTEYSVMVLICKGVICSSSPSEILEYIGLKFWLSICCSVVLVQGEFTGARGNSGCPSRGQFVGVLSALDFIMIVRELGSHGSNLMEEELETHTISAWKDAKSYLSRQIDGNGRLFRRQLVHAGLDENLKDVAFKILQNNVAVYIIHSSSGNASIPQLLHLASLSGILKCICRYFKHSFGTLPMLQLPICAIPLGTWVPGIGETNRWPLAMLRPRSSLGLALSLLVQADLKVNKRSVSSWFV
ncbi:Sucrose nonfermenting 4-like protein [Camellia lanceoleosa]|uniref:Sucrose nonfermenting 4-like protein n=1 Tax=Camellia lanceoleosa TaxID=1840588 RepID=A0ACC0HCA6_9ERIC|nr:Sucrose nonfermenting 4-like protein [Camellia lanceoleosa]